MLHCNTECTVRGLNVNDFEMTGKKNKNLCLVQLCRAREVELQEEVASLRQEKQELQYNICLLEKDNQTLREEIQNLRGKTSES